MFTTDTTIAWTDRAALSALLDKLDVDWFVNSGDIVMRREGEHTKTVIRIRFIDDYNDSISHVLITQYSWENGYWGMEDSWNIDPSLAAVIATWLELG